MGRLHERPPDDRDLLAALLPLWEILAAFAWEGYCKLGRGIVCLSNEAQTVMLTYVEPGLSRDFLAQVMGVQDAVQHTVLSFATKQYNPDREIVVVTPFRGQVCVLVLAPPAGRQTPPAVYRQQQGEADGTVVVALTA
jgi:hypothetical protein